VVAHGAQADESDAHVFSFVQIVVRTILEQEFKPHALSILAHG
jgi:hypothetical protein